MPPCHDHGLRVQTTLFLIHTASSRNLRTQLVSEKRKQKLFSWNVSQSLILFFLPCSFHLMFLGIHLPFPAANSHHSLGSHTQLLAGIRTQFLTFLSLTNSFLWFLSSTVTLWISSLHRTKYSYVYSKVSTINSYPAF